MPVASIWTGPSIRPTEHGCTSTPRNSERNRATPNSPESQPRGGRLEQLVVSETVDWFPHLSPNGEFATYVSFPIGTRGHPADLDVEVRLVRTTDWSTPIARYPLFGGQGTINVNSWSPDSRRFAFVAYPINA
jgi:Tol biopolymer transport system component